MAVELTTLTDGGQTPADVARAVAAFVRGARASLDLALYDIRLGSAAGALVLAARWSWLSVDEATFPTYANPIQSAQSAHSFGGAITWVPRRTARYAVAYDQTRFDGGSGIAAMGMNPAVLTNRLTEHALIFRAQANF